jgi:hypothetical protein
VYNLSLSGLEIKLIFELDHPNGKLSFAIVDEETQTLLVDDKVLTLEEFSDNNPEMILEELCESL